MKPNFRQRLLSGERLIGTIVTLDSPEIVEILCQAGFDWLFLDAEHAPLSSSALQRLMQAAGDVPCLVRVARCEEIWIKRALDAGAAGIIVPQVNTAAQVEQIVAWAKYPPLGARGIGVARAQGYGFRMKSYLESANEDIAIIIQAEHVRAVENIDAICKVSGLDAVFVGPNDLAASMGLLGQLANAQVLGAIDTISAACRSSGIRLGIFGLSEQTLLPYAAQGYSLLLAGVDTLFLGNAVQPLIRALRS